MQGEAPVRPAFSVWTWLVLAPYLVIALGGFDGAQTAREWTAGVSTALVVHVALGIAFGVGALVERLLRGRPIARWTFVGLAIGGLAVGRPLLIQTLQQMLGVQLVPTPMPIRVMMNAAVLAIAVLLIHAAFESVAHNLDVRRRLLAVLVSLRAQADRIEAEQSRIAASFRREITEPVLDALGRLVPRDLSADQLAEELESLAEGVVRPISHRAREAGLDEALEDIDPTLPPPSPTDALLRPSRIAAAPAWAVTAVTMLLLLSPEIGSNGLPTGALLLLAAAATAFLGSTLIRRIPLPRRPARAIAQLAALYLALGLLSVWILLGQLRTSRLADYYVVYGAVGFAIAAVVLSVILSSTRELAANQQRMATAIAHAERRVFRAREALVASGEGVTRRLHTGVQGDIVGTAMRLKAGTAEPEALDNLLDRVEQTLARDGQPPAEDPGPAAAIREALAASIASWSRSLDLRSEISDAALDWLAAHPSAAAAANDAITEGLTNAVRHGSTASARLRLECSEDGVEIRVANPGRLGARAAGGLGLRDLDARAKRVRLEQEDGEVVLSVLV